MDMLLSLAPLNRQDAKARYFARFFDPSRAGGSPPGEQQTPQTNPKMAHDGPETAKISQRWTGDDPRWLRTAPRLTKLNH